MHTAPGKFNVTYSIDDGYAGKDRPQHMTIRECDLEEDMDEAALNKLLDDAVQEHFEQNISPYPTERSRSEFLDWAKQQIANRDKE